MFAVFEQAEPVLDLRDAQLELVPLLACDEAEILGDVLHAAFRPLPHTHCVAAPAGRHVVEGVAPPTKNSAPTGSSVLNVVASERRIVSHSEMFTIVANDARRMIGTFSRTRSKMMIVS